MNSPLVSVIMPVYNVEAYIREAIQSVLDQSFRDFELIIIDDGSQDGGIAIAESFADPRIRIVRQTNRGLAGARNSGIAAARGEFVALLDSDDRWDPMKLMLHVIHLRASPHVDVSYAGSRMIDGSGHPLRTAMNPRVSSVSPGHIMKRNPVGNGSAAVIRRSALDAVAFPHPSEPGRICWFDESFRQSEDIEMWLRMAAGHDCVFEGIEGLLTDYRVVGGGLSANVLRQFDTWKSAIANARGYAPDLVRREYPAALAYQLRYLARRAVQLGDGRFASALMRQAMMSKPSILLAEPIKTGVTLVAAILGRILPPALFGSLVHRQLAAGPSS